MLGWNVGGVYLVACAFQAVILVCAAYTLFFLKSVLISFSPKFSVHRSLLLRINQCSSSLIFQFIQLSSHKLQETGVEKPRAKCCDHLILSVQTLLKFSSIKHQTTCFVYIPIFLFYSAFSSDSSETFRGKETGRRTNCWKRKGNCWKRRNKANLAEKDSQDEADSLVCLKQNQE